MDVLDALRQAHEDGAIGLDCGCVVEPDGTCECGNESPLLTYGLI